MMKRNTTQINTIISAISAQLFRGTVGVILLFYSTMAFSQKDKGPDILSQVLSSLAPPVNDLCENAIAITCDTTLLGSTLEATTIGAPLGTFCGTNVSAAGIWYTIIGNGGPIILSTCSPATNYDTRIHVFSGSCGSFICVNGNDDASPVCASNSLASELSFMSNFGATYFVYVSGFGGATGNFELTSSSTSACYGPNIPTLSEWGILILFLSIAILGIAAIRKSHTIQSV